MDVLSAKRKSMQGCSRERLILVRTLPTSTEGSNPIRCSRRGAGLCLACIGEGGGEGGMLAQALGPLGLPTGLSSELEVFELAMAFESTVLRSGVLLHCRTKPAVDVSSHMPE